MMKETSRFGIIKVGINVSTLPFGAANRSALSAKLSKPRAFDIFRLESKSD